MSNTPDRILSDALLLASQAAGLLADAGTRVVGAYANGRRPVLLIDTPPAFVRGVVKQRCRPEGGQQRLVLAAGYHGCQIEWNETVPVPAEVRHG